MAIKLGAVVRQKVVVIEGVVVQRQFNESADQVEYLVETVDADGNKVPRWFREDQIEVTEEV